MDIFGSNGSMCQATPEQAYRSTSRLAQILRNYVKILPVPTGIYLELQYLCLLLIHPSNFTWYICVLLIWHFNLKH